MKKLFLLMGFCCSMSLANAQQTQEVQRTLQDNEHHVIATIRNNTLFDKNNAFLGQFKAENGAYAVYNSHHKAIGYIVKEQEIQDASHNTIGYFKLNRTDYTVTVEDAQHAMLGMYRPGGIIENKDHTVIGYTELVEPMFSCVYYFLLKF